jgi:hypothetical protein
MIRSHSHEDEDPSEISYAENSYYDEIDKQTSNIGIKNTYFLGIKNETNAIAAIGILQGLASNDELLLLLAFSLGMNNLFVILIGIAIFSIGVMTGMISWGSLINLPGLKTKREKILKVLSVTIAVLAIVYGVYLLSGGVGISLLPLAEV